MNRARLYTLDANGDPLKVEDFDYIETAMEAAEASANEKLEWGDTQIGYEAMTAEGRKHMDETGEYPLAYFQIVGITETGEDDEVMDEYHRPEEE